MKMADRKIETHTERERVADPRVDSRAGGTGWIVIAVIAVALAIVAYYFMTESDEIATVPAANEPAVTQPADPVAPTTSGTTEPEPAPAPATESNAPAQGRRSGT